MASIDRFDAGLNEVKRLVELDPSHQEDLDPDDSLVEVGASVRRAAVVLLVSHFEGFLKAVGEELLDALSDGTIETRSIPRGVREVHVMPRLAEVVACNDITQRFALLAKLGGISSLWNDAAKPSKGTLRASVISRTIHNADSECIDNLFQMFGLTEQVCNGEIDVWDHELEVEQSDDIRARLRDIVKCRNDIAHGGIDRRPTRDDVRRYLIFLTHFSRRLDRKRKQLIERYESFAVS